MLDSSSRNTSPLEFLHGLIAGLPPYGEDRSSFRRATHLVDSGYGFLRDSTERQGMVFCMAAISGLTA